MAKGRKLFRARSKALLLSAALLALVLGLHVIHQEKIHVESIARMEFEQEAAERAAAIENMLESALHRSDSTAIFAAASLNLSEAEFRHFVNHSGNNCCGHLATSLAGSVRSSRRAVFERIHNEAQPTHDYAISDLDADGNRIPAPEREHYFPLMYVSRDSSKFLEGVDVSNRIG